MNSIILFKIKAFFITLLYKQNKHHRHGILLHTFKVVLELIKAKKYKMVLAGLLHDIGKPFCAHQKPEDILNNEFSFTDHEEVSYQIIKNIPFIRDYTKTIVRYHYLIRKIEKESGKGKDTKRLRDTYKNLPDHIKEDLIDFMKCDDKGK